MKKSVKAIIIAAVGVLALGATAAYAGPVIYRDFFAAPPAPEPVLLSADDAELEGAENEEAAADDEQASAADLSGTWVVSEGSVAGYRVDEVLAGTPVTVTGSTTAVSGSLEVSGLTLESAQFEVDVTSIATDERQRDSVFRELVGKNGAEPTARFVLTEPITASSAPLRGEIIEQALTGELTIAGVTRPVSFAAQVRLGDTSVEIAGQIPITFADFGITAPNLGFVSVESQGMVEFSLLATRS